MKLQVAKFQKRIQWRNDASCTGIDEMVQAAKKDMDCGIDQTNKLMPTHCYHAWVKFCYIHTKLYNRDRPADAGELLCIIRMVLFINCVLFIMRMTAVVRHLFNSDRTISSVRPIQRTMRRRRV